MIDPTVKFKVATWGVRIKGRHRLMALELKYLRNMCGVIKMERLRIEKVDCRVKAREILRISGNQKILKCFGYVERVSVKQLSERVNKADAWCERDSGGLSQSKRYALRDHWS